jgi:hypothetical protein
LLALFPKAGRWDSGFYKVATGDFFSGSKKRGEPQALRHMVRLREANWSALVGGWG